MASTAGHRTSPTSPVRDEPTKEGAAASAPRGRWLMLTILCVDICVSYLPYYTFVPILPQTMQVYDVQEQDVNVLCILYALAFVPGAFLTGPLVTSLGCRRAFVAATVLNVLGCALRCEPETLVAVMWRERPAPELDFERHGSSNFRWLVLGQGLCALGQPFLVNSTSQLGAEWFPPQERPGAAMVSNLMNFIGSSLSFMLPPLLVDVHGDPSQANVGREVAALLVLQLELAIAACVLTVFCFQTAPVVPVLAGHRAQVSFFAEVRRFFVLRDFWLVNGQFIFYVAVCLAFDAVEGSLLERYGYGAALSSWTAASCTVGAIVGTVVESSYVTDPALYRAALIGINAVLAVSLVAGCFCLVFQLHEAGIVLAVGIMGLCTPGWGISFELGSEVCFPAREATVSSFLEACSNLVGVVGIIATQRLIDAGMGAGVLVLLAVGPVFGGFLLLGLSGRFRRSEAEAREGDVKEAVDADVLALPEACELKMPGSPIRGHS